MVVKDNRKTPIFDWEQGEFATDLTGRVKMATGALAVEQIILKAQHTIRGLFLVYAADPEVVGIKGHTYGSDLREIRKSDLPLAAKHSELERAIKEAVIYDPWIRNVSEITITHRSLDEAEITATIDHIYGTDIVTFRT
ncbi:DUF2634 domain-containing protein [Paenibacillus sp. L3-i20]|uniref:DUF2634 domain-containing protein n=1 Tax=Paenibacillus sp. L3-i20 TaxID=2905833 RepID=UPI001EDDBDF7|nr:DUF2634 domain-containing protein [Paenibacillus sp. L3-i20]GKU79283.1 hypothetical protein L3i20_v236800 [Paenibacillus sp. L3-i20]